MFGVRPSVYSCDNNNNIYLFCSIKNNKGPMIVVSWICTCVITRLSEYVFAFIFVGLVV